VASAATSGASPSFVAAPTGTPAAGRAVVGGASSAVSREAFFFVAAARWAKGPQSVTFLGGWPWVGCYTAARPASSATSTGVPQQSAAARARRARQGIRQLNVRTTSVPPTPILLKRKSGLQTWHSASDADPSSGPYYSGPCAAEIAGNWANWADQSSNEDQFLFVRATQVMMHPVSPPPSFLVPCIRSRWEAICGTTPKRAIAREP